MHLSVAKSLISQGIQQTNHPQHWIDLGAGDGLFTQALTDLLPEGSSIIAIDKDEVALSRIKASKSIIVQKIQSDFADLPPIGKQDGIIIANALHYVRSQAAFLNSLRRNYLKPQGVIILIEYDLRNANLWVPYPIPTAQLSSMIVEAGFENYQIMERVPSRLNASEIYSALLKQ